MNKHAAGVPPTDGATPKRSGASCRPRVDQKIFIPAGWPGGFVMVKYAENGKALLFFSRDDGGQPFFREVPEGFLCELDKRA